MGISISLTDSDVSCYRESSKAEFSSQDSEKHMIPLSQEQLA
jgi:hypothetical protein